MSTRPMRPCRRIALLLALAGAAAAGGAAGDEPAPKPDATAPDGLSLPFAIEHALAHNPDLHALAVSVESREVTLGGARDTFRFTVTPEVTANSADDHGLTAYGATVDRRFSAGTEARLGSRATHERFDGAAGLHRGSVFAELRQPLLRSAGRLVNAEPVVRADSQWLAARRLLELRRTDLIVQVVESYEDLLRLQRESDYAQRTADRLDQHARLTRAREQQGRASRIDALRADLKTGEARVRVTDLSEQLAAARAAFVELIGYAAGVPVAAVPSPRLAVRAHNDADALAAAFSNRLDYAQILQDREDASRGVRIARHGLLPDFDLIGRYERAGEDESAGGAFALDEDAWFVGVAGRTDLPLRSERQAVDQARLTERTAALRGEALRAAIRRQVAQSLAAYRGAEAALPLAERNHALARDRAELAARFFEMGRGDAFTVADAEDERRQAEARWLAAQAAASIAAARLLRATGTLLEYPSELKPHGRAAQLDDTARAGEGG